MESNEKTEPKGPVGQGDYVVRQGDCVDSISMEHGFFWETLWNHPNNAQLKQLREDPFVLLPGDRVFIPDLRLKQEGGVTEQRHRFRRKGVPSIFRLQLLAGGEPRAGEAYRLIIDGTTHRGMTNDEGHIEVRIPPNAHKGQLIIGEDDDDQETIDLDLGGLDPITEITGVQTRLENLGYGCGQPGELDEETRAAIATFQEAHELDPTGEMNDATRERLLGEHGS